MAEKSATVSKMYAHTARFTRRAVNPALGETPKDSPLYIVYIFHTKFHPLSELTYTNENEKEQENRVGIHPFSALSLSLFPLSSSLSLVLFNRFPFVRSASISLFSSCPYVPLVCTRTLSFANVHERRAIRAKAVTHETNILALFEERELVASRQDVLCFVAEGGFRFW